MSENFSITGKIVGVKPRGNPKGEVQTFWTLEVQERPQDQYPKKVSFSSHTRAGDEVPEFKIAWDALKNGAPVTIHGYLSDNDKNPEYPYKNGTEIEWASGDAATAQAATTSTPAAVDDGWGPSQPAQTSSVSSAPATNGWVDKTADIQVSWAIKCAIQALGPGCNMEQVHGAAHKVLILQKQILSELAE